MNQSENNQPSECLGGCGFYGSEANEGYCSVCFKFFSKKCAAIPRAEHEPTLGTSASEPAVLEPAVVEPVRLPTLSPLAAPQPPVQAQLPAAAAAGAKATCAVCQRKVKPLPFVCRCGGAFCRQHLHAEAHDCSFDYQSFARERLSARIAAAPPHDGLERI